MAVFPNFKLTNNGVNLLNRVIAEKKILKFTKFQIGNGIFSGDIKTLDTLVSKFKEFPVIETNSLPNGMTGIKGYFDNKGLLEQKHLREVGIFAQIGDEVVTEVLFSYTNAGETADIIPAQTTFFSRTLSVLNKTGDVQNVTFNLNLEFKKTDFNTVAELKSATWLSAGDKINLWGNLVLGDTKKTSKIIVAENTGIPLLNGLYAKDYANFIESTGDIVSGKIDFLEGATFGDDSHNIYILKGDGSTYLELVPKLRGFVDYKWTDSLRYYADGWRIGDRYKLFHEGFFPKFSRVAEGVPSALNNLNIDLTNYNEISIVQSSYNQNLESQGVIRTRSVFTFSKIECQFDTLSLPTFNTSEQPIFIKNINNKLVFSNIGGNPTNEDNYIIVYLK